MYCSHASVTSSTFSFAARFRDATRANFFDGPGVALAAGLHEADLA